MNAERASRPACKPAFLPASARFESLDPGGEGQGDSSAPLIRVRLLLIRAVRLQIAPRLIQISRL